MPSIFTIKPATTSLQLDSQGKATCTVSVTNDAASRVEARLRLVPCGATQAEWLSVVGEAEQPFAPNECREFTIALALPPATPAGTYQFRPDVYSVARPDDDCTSGTEISVALQGAGEPAPKKGFPVWIPIVAVAALLVIGGIIGLVLMLGREPAAEPAAPVVAQATMPDLVGKPLAEAKALLAEHKLPEPTLSERSTGGQKEGAVVSQDPPAGAPLAAEGVTVALVTEAKQAPVAIVVPRLVGQDRGQAELLLKKGGLTLGTVKEGYEPERREGQVLKQLPEPGSYDQPVAAVHLVVQGPSAKVPEVRRQSFLEAKALLERSGLQVADTSVYNTQLAPGTVISQNIDAGSVVQRGTVVTLQVAHQLRRVEPIREVSVQPLPRAVVTPVLTAPVATPARKEPVKELSTRQLQTVKEPAPSPLQQRTLSAPAPR